MLASSLGVIGIVTGPAGSPVRSLAVVRRGAYRRGMLRALVACVWVVLAFCARAEADVIVGIRPADPLPETIEIARALAAQHDAIAECNVRTGVAFGEVALDVEVSARGRVASSVATSELGNRALEGCIVGVVDRARFARGSVRVGRVIVRLWGADRVVRFTRGHRTETPAPPMGSEIVHAQTTISSTNVVEIFALPSSTDTATALREGLPALAHCDYSGANVVLALTIVRGRVTRVVIDPAFVETPTSRCVADAIANVTFPIATPRRLLVRVATHMRDVRESVDF
jgi:hypothetical protein